MTGRPPGLILYSPSRQLLSEFRPSPEGKGFGHATFAPAAFLLLGPASIAFAYVTPGPLFEANGYAFSAGYTDRAVIADLNRDGLGDLILGDESGIAVALATAAGSFGAFQHRLTHLASASP